MRVLHYTLGLPPYRTGGLTKYTYDLMIEQINNQYDIYLLFPGEIKKNKKLEIKQYKNINGIKSYEIVNPLPVPLLNGVSEALEYMTKVDYTIYKEFLEKINVDIINIHTLMGLHQEFIIAAKELNIPIIYTAHDYYGLCTKVNFIDNNGELCKSRDVKKCIKCNNDGYSLRTIYMLQSKPYRELKSAGIIDKLKLILAKIRKHHKNVKNINVEDNSIFTKDKIESFMKLLNYYENIFNNMDLFIFNSTITQEIYNKYLTTKGIVTNITHRDIKDNRKKREYSSADLKLLYLGPSKSYKGFDLICDVMKELEVYDDITLYMYGNLDNNICVPNNVQIKGKYKYNQLERIFDSIDLLIVPSIWKETFGFITLEAISYGVPVIVTENVGSKDIVDLENKNGIVVRADKGSLKNTIIEIYNDKNILKKFNDNIIINEFNYSLEEHFEFIDKIYRS